MIIGLEPNLSRSSKKKTQILVFLLSYQLLCLLMSCLIASYLFYTCLFLTFYVRRRLFSLMLHSMKNIYLVITVCYERVGMRLFVVSGVRFGFILNDPHFTRGFISTLMKKKKNKASICSNIYILLIIVT